jgi:hypothetical protein
VKLRKTFKTFMTAAALSGFAVVASFAALSVASYVVHSFAWRSEANVPQPAPVTEMAPATKPAPAPAVSGATPIEPVPAPAPGSASGPAEPVPAPEPVPMPTPEPAPEATPQPPPRAPADQR